MPRAIIIAGPNGVGKTTFARSFLPNEAKVFQFLNADLIASRLSPLRAAAGDVTAGRILIQRLDHLVEIGSSFALETTLSGSEQWVYNVDGDTPVLVDSGLGVGT